ncbi:hypothetical protein [Photorhabdus stackebrandtii]|uniref:hypothetical protein n=1 Tax=Photorhabdus stackebrandtii TaxID=1123042 RepID=UPI00140B2CCA|nr:hypothetical protein [Photorhabdus stackebrandtii]
MSLVQVQLEEPNLSPEILEKFPTSSDEESAKSPMKIGLFVYATAHLEYQLD